MTQKIYKTARGKSVDVGSLRLQNEHVRAVGNMGVNARGDRIDAEGNIVDPRNHQVQRRIQRQSNVSSGRVHSSTRNQQSTMATATDSTPVALTPEVPITAPAAPEIPVGIVPKQTEITTDAEKPVGLAAAIARSKTIKQELEKTARQKAKDQPLRRI
jgi:hypothetical protein